MILGSGIDVVEVARIERALARFGPRFERRVFAPAEVEACRGCRRPARSYAMRFAAKEALMKAVGTGWSRGVRWVDIETQGAAGGKTPLRLVLHGRVGELVRARGGSAVHLATGAGRDLAVAAVLVENAAT